MTTAVSFWQPAEDRKQVWRTLLGLVIVFAIWIALSLGILLAAADLLGLPVWRVAQGRSWSTAAAFFLGFLGFHLGLLVVLPLLHRRGYASLLGPSRRLNWRHFRAGLATALAIAAALYGVMGLEHLVLPDGVSPPILPAQPLLPWLLGLVPALLLILMQTFAEEAVFRGYLLQQLRARFRSVLVWAVLPSLLFGLLHFDASTYGTLNAAVYVLNAAVMGSLAALITARTGNLAAAIGLHFGNNATMVLIGLRGSLDGFSLFVVDMDLKSGYATYSILTQTAVMALVFALWWRWMGRHRPIANNPAAS